ncbi:uncharacterized protein LOC125610208 [Brassica napus]|uniref:uncharacterized protein LOC125610208 n=1 Tax=Brassica napus TaxID=3708 RepID=UPI0020786651|nr:uncharacterized protein LOC125610208 [Brassica napus]
MGNVDHAFESMSLEEDEVPFDLPDLPQFSAIERNKMSILGRTLNPDNQNIADLIRDMPRKWQVYGRVHGIVLSKTTFQIVFKYEHDLEEVLNKRVWTFNDWSIVIDRWTETPDEDYLKYLLVWVRIRNIPVNHYTEGAITALGDIIGRVDVVAFDPDKPQTNDYVRVRVFFDVSRPVRRSKVVNLPKGGGSVTILYDFERIQKRCYHCQRLTHEKDKCPILIQERQDKAKAWRKKVSEDNQKEEEGKQTFMVTIDKDDPLFGVLNEDQVGVDKATGRRKINPEVLQQMREYILAAEGGEKRIRQERVRKSVSDLDNDPLGQKKFLRLEAAPLIIHEVDKGKGFVFGYSNQNEQNHSREDGSRGSSSWVEKEKGPLRSGSGVGRGDRDSNPTEKGNNFFFECSTGFSSGFSTASSSGTKKD